MMTPFEWRSVLAIVAGIGCGLIVGQMLAIAIAKRAAQVLPEENWTRTFQLENIIFTKTMPFALMIPFLTLLTICIFLPGSGRVWYVAATVMLAMVLAITMIFNVPINNQVASWQPGSAPVLWTKVRDRWLHYHDLRTGIGVLSFICTVIAMNTR